MLPVSTESPLFLLRSPVLPKLFLKTFFFFVCVNSWGSRVSKRPIAYPKIVKLSFLLPSYHLSYVHQILVGYLLYILLLNT